MKARLRLLAFILPELEDHTLFVLAEAVRLKTEDLTLSMETKPLPTDVGRFKGRVVLDVLKYDLVGYQPACCTEEAPRPEVPPPIAFAEVGELHLYLARGTSL